MPSRTAALAILLGSLSACSGWSTMHPANDLASLPAATEESSMPYPMLTPVGLPNDPAQDRNDVGGPDNGP
jgi:hypothetical protein